MMEDQSTFINNTENLQPPPEELERIKQENSLEGKRKKRKQIILGILFGVFGLALLSLVIIKLQMPVKKQEVVTISPTAYIPQTKSEMEEAIIKLEDVVFEANPAAEFPLIPGVELKLDL